MSNEAASAQLSSTRTHDIYPVVPDLAPEGDSGLPTPIRTLLFDRSDAEPDGHSKTSTFAVLDAAKLLGLPEILASSGLPHACLFRDPALEDYGDTAPWLVELEEDHRLTRDLVTQSDAQWHLWGRDAGIFMRGAFTLADLRSHLRKFTKVRDDTGAWFFFRFWEPKSAEAYFSYLCDRPEKAALWFPERLKALSFHVPVFQENAFLTIHAESHQDGMNPSKPFVFGPEEMQLLRMQQVTDFEQRLGQHLNGQSGGFADLTEAEKTTKIRELSAMAGSYEFTREQAVANFALAAVLCGQHPANVDELKNILKDRKLGQIKRSEELLMRVRNMS